QLFLLRVEIELLVQLLEVGHRAHSFGRLRPDRARAEQAGREQRGSQFLSVSFKHVSLLRMDFEETTRAFSRAVVSRLFPDGKKSLQIVSGGPRRRGLSANRARGPSALRAGRT